MVSPGFKIINLGDAKDGIIGSEEIMFHVFEDDLSCRVVAVERKFSKGHFGTTTNRDRIVREQLSLA